MQNPLRFALPPIVSRRLARRAARAASIPAQPRPLDVPLAMVWPAVVAGVLAQPLWLSLCGLMLMSAPAWMSEVVHSGAAWSHYTQTGIIRVLYQAPSVSAIALRLAMLCLGRTTLRLVWLHRATKPNLPHAASLLMGEISHTLVSLAAALCLTPLLSAFYFDAAQSWHVWVGFERAAQDSWRQIVWHSLAALWPQAELAAQVTSAWAPAWARMLIGLGVFLIGTLSFPLGIARLMQPKASLTAAFRLGWVRPWLLLKHLGMVWGMAFAAQSVLIEAPIAFVMHGLLPHVVRQTSFVAAIPLVSLGSALCSFLAAGVWMVVAMHYESRLADAIAQAT